MLQLSAVKNGVFRCDWKMLKIITASTCNVKYLQLSAVMSKVCFDFFIVVLTFEKGG